MKNTLLFCCLFLTCTSNAQTTLAERLGYPANAKLLIIHADDLGVAHAENLASFEAMEKGCVNSGSIMAPCSWLPEVADYVKTRPDLDLGLHLTVTSEWKHYKWGPAAPRNEVRSLVDNNGYFYADCAEFAAHAKPEEVEKELRAQIERAQALGIRPTHLDTHMGCLAFSTPAIFEVYLQVGRSYGLPVLLSRDLLSVVPEAMKKALTEKDVLLDRIFMANPEDYHQGLNNYYENVLHSLQPGVSIILLHAAFDDLEMQGISIEHPDWGSSWRQEDYIFFSSERCQQLLDELDIKLVTWREIGKVMKQ